MQVSVAQNNDMRKIAAWAAIRCDVDRDRRNLRHNFDFMPELRWRWGYAGVMALMAGSAFALYHGFKHSGWL